jgi:oligopeptide/dipeptide ABC transporter ATP-binding protein
VAGSGVSALLEVRDLRAGFHTDAGVVRAVDGLSFDVDRGRTLCIVGESGCGKSATGLAILGLLPERATVSGSVRFDGRELTALGEREREDLRGRDLAVIFQDPMTSLNPTMRVGRQIAEVLRRHLGDDRASARRRASELLEEVQIPRAEDRLGAYPHELSGGMRQRVMIAMALACNPKLLIADEPTTALDVTIQADVLHLLERLRTEHDMAMILITHDMGVVARVADSVLVMYAGQVVESAPVVELFEHPEHPYTEALLGALPQVERPDVRQAPLTAIPGQPPDLIALPPGCRFAPRCPHADIGDDCAATPPPLRELRPGHWVRTAHPASERSRRGIPALP